jgi:hypothetical protein
MKLISHRGNLNGPDTSNENKLDTIHRALNAGYDCEVDIWKVSDELFLGHDGPLYFCDFHDLDVIKDRLWIHCKNIPALNYFHNLGAVFNYFWHENDVVTLTSKGFIWAFPGKQPILNSIAVMPEIFGDQFGSFNSGVCSDYISLYDKI